MHLTGKQSQAQYERNWAHGSPLRSIIALTHPTAVLIFTTITVVLAVIAQWPAVDLAVVLTLGAAMALGQATVGLSNEIADRHIDSISKPWRALPSGLIGKRTAIGLAAVCWILASALAATVSIGSMLGLVLGIGIGVSYNLWLKRTALSWVPYALAYPLVPVWVWYSVGEPVLEVMPVYLLAAPLAVSIHMVNQMRDYDADEAAGVRGLVQHLGKRRAVGLCRALIVIGPVPALVWQVFAGPARLPYLLLASACYWLLLASPLRRCQGAPDPSVFRTLFRRQQLAAPMLLLAWIVNLP